MHPRASLLVLGMHRSGTSAITGALGLCGAWVGEEGELTGANVENPRGFWERRDIREICDRLLQTAGADWWKVANFDLEAVPRAVLAEERKKFARIVTTLAERGTWVLKEPRLCLLLPALRDYVADPVCIHIFRNPLEVARSLQMRNGFGIAGGLALWEAYNLHALNAARNLPRIPVFHESLMLRPMETVTGILGELAELGVEGLAAPNEARLEQFINPSLYRKRVAKKEANDFLSASQRTLWRRLCSGEIRDEMGSLSLPRTTRQHLFDLESTERSLNQFTERTNALNREVSARKRTIRELESRTARLTTELGSKRSAISAHQRTITAREKTIESQAERIGAREATIESQAERIGAREATIESQAERIGAHEATIESQAERIGAHEVTIESQAERIGAHEATIESHKAAIGARDATIRALLESTSWRVTAPMRALVRGARWFRRNLARVFRLLFWLITGRFSRAFGSIGFALRRLRRSPDPDGGTPRPRRADAVSDLIREHRKKHSASGSFPAASGPREARTKVSVIAWDVGHNPLGRAYLLADVLRNEYEVELIGANFPRFGTDVWKPLRGARRVTLKTFRGANFPEHFGRMEDVAEQIEGDVIYVSKPRLPSLELAILAKLQRNRPVVLDIDDYELGFFEDRRPLSLAELKAGSPDPGVDCPHDGVWTRISESLIPHFERITVSNEELRRKYGGTVLPHVRDEADFAPDIYPRDAIRRELGFAPDDRVILFAGTPRMHKGFARLVDALRELERPEYKMLVVGSPADGESYRFLNGLKSPGIRCVVDVPFADLPGYLSAGDLVCLLQDEDSATSAFQMPAKFTDALAMGIPVLASNVPPLANLAEKGLVELLGDRSPAEGIDEIFSKYPACKERALANREVFLREYSYGAGLARLKEIIEGVKGRPRELPAAFHELIACQRSLFAVTEKVAPTALEVFPATASSDERSGEDDAVARGNRAKARRRVARPRVDDKLDIVFFWKQNDTGIYGRRQDMFVKYLAKDERVSRIFHFDAPFSFFRAAVGASKSGAVGRSSHAWLVLRQTLRRKLGRENREKIRFDTFVFVTGRSVPPWLKHVLPSEKGYIDYLERRLRRHGVGRRRTVFWVCPNDFHFAAVEERHGADLVIADVIDDQRKWPIPPRYRERLDRNYAEVLARSDLVLANCRTVVESMKPFSDNIHLVPNAVEILEGARAWPKPRELARMDGPIVGYVGNLDIIRIDLDLLKAVASARPDWNLVFIGSLHKGKEIRELDQFRNVHFLGVRVYDQALRYIRHFDVAMIPHLDNDLTRSMNPLKLYVYQSLHVPVVTTAIANTGDFREFMEVGRTPDEFIDRIEGCLNENRATGNPSRIRELLTEVSWERRVEQVLALVEEEFASRERPSSTSKKGKASDEASSYFGTCSVCGRVGSFLREKETASIRESFKCESCGSSLRYREQARLILEHFSVKGSRNLDELANEPDFQRLDIYEPGLGGPFRRLFRKLPGYCTSYFWEDLVPGQLRDGVQCQDLMNLTFEDDTFDLVITSDIFEHVRKPFVGFSEVNRVLKPGGVHVFSVPAQCPMRAKSVFRVDTSGPEDKFVLPAHYHNSPTGEKSLVYTDFGADMVDRLFERGISLELARPVMGPPVVTERMLSFFWKRTAEEATEVGQPVIREASVDKGRA